MAHKIHLQANKAESGRDPFARCAARSDGRGTVRSNSRSTYQSIPVSHIVSAADFKVARREDVCSHCCDAGLIVRNRQRRDKGLPPVTSFFD